MCNKICSTSQTDDRFEMELHPQKLPDSIKDSKIPVVQNDTQVDQHVKDQASYSPIQKIKATGQSSHNQKFNLCP